MLMIRPAVEIARTIEGPSSYDVFERHDFFRHLERTGALWEWSRAIGHPLRLLAILHDGYKSPSATRPTIHRATTFASLQALSSIRSLTITISTMLVPTLLAALAALPAISAQTTSTRSEITTDCFTRFGFNPLPTGTAAIPTWYSFTATTKTYQVTYTTRDTIYVTPSATVRTDVVTTSIVVTTTTTSTPSATTVATSSGFMPLLVIDMASPTPLPPISRIKRLELEGRSEVGHALKRQTPPGNSGGFIAYPNGTYSGLYRRYPHQVNCTVAVNYEETVTTVVKGDPETRVAPQQTATAVSTVTRSVTTIVTAVAPRPTIWAACAGNNVVNHITDVDGNKMVFDRIIYRPQEGFPVANELVVSTEDAKACCAACQTTPNCAGSFYAAGISECHLRLTQPYAPALPQLPSGSNNSTNGTLALALATGTTAASARYPVSTGTPGNGTCNAGSMSLYMGTIRGQNNFPEKYALSFSNGPCGRFSVSPIAVPVEGDGPVRRGISGV